MRPLLQYTDHVIICMHCCLRYCTWIYSQATYVTGPTKIGHVGTNYTPSHNRTYLSVEIEYLHSVTVVIKSMNCLISVKNMWP